MIIANLTSVPANSPVVEYVFAFDIMLKRYAIFSILLAVLLVLIGGFFFWSRDFVFSAKNGLYVITFTSFLCTLVKSTVFLDSDGNGFRLLSFAKFTFFLILLALIVFYDEVSD